MSIQVENGEFTRLHNVILDKLAVARFAASEYRCLLFLFRMTYGWQRKEHDISMTEWARGTGVDPAKRQNVWRTLQGMIAKGVIYAKSNGNNRPMTWGFNKHFEEWDGSLFDETVISHDNSLAEETVITTDNSRARTVITHDNTSVITHDNSTVITGDNTNIRRKKVKESKEKERETRPPNVIPSGVVGAKQIRISSPHLDPRHFVNGFVPPGTGTSAVEVYYERFSINRDDHRLTTPHEDDLVLHCKDLTLLREVITAYHQSPHRARNIKLILDWYRDPSRFRKTQHGHAYNGRSTTHHEPPPVADFSQREWDEYNDPRAKEIPY